MTFEREAGARRPASSVIRCAGALAVLAAMVVGSDAAGSAAQVASAASKHQYGINVQFYDYGLPNTTLSTDATTTLSYVKSLGGNSVAITIPFEVPTLTANTVQPESWTPTPSRVGIVIKDATKLKLHVMLRPLVDERNLFLSWRGAFKPSNPSVWFANYETFLKPYLQVAQTDKASAFDVATELQGTYKLPQWPSLISKAKSSFKGTIIVSGSWGNGATKHMNGASSGIDAYLGVSSPTTASVATLLAAWNANLKQHRFPVAPSMTTLTEVGIAAQDGAYKKPNRPSIGMNTPIDAMIQTNWFTAACRFVHQHSLVGIYFWRLDIGSSPTLPPTPSNPTLFAPTTVSEIKACFSGK